MHVRNVWVLKRSKSIKIEDGVVVNDTEIICLILGDGKVKEAAVRGIEAKNDNGLVRKI